MDDAIDANALHGSMRGLRAQSSLLGQGLLVARRMSDEPHLRLGRIVAAQFLDLARRGHVFVGSAPPFDVAILRYRDKTADQLRSDEAAMLDILFEGHPDGRSIEVAELLDRQLSVGRRILEAADRQMMADRQTGPLSDQRHRWLDAVLYIVGGLTGFAIAASLLARVDLPRLVEQLVEFAGVAVGAVVAAGISRLLARPRTAGRRLRLQLVELARDMEAFERGSMSDQSIESFYLDALPYAVMFQRDNTWAARVRPIPGSRYSIKNVDLKPTELPYFVRRFQALTRS